MQQDFFVSSKNFGLIKLKTIAGGYITPQEFSAVFYTFTIEMGLCGIGMTK
jgi:hypothetical protein